jgi:hypothetical protein
MTRSSSSSTVVDAEDYRGSLLDCIAILTSGAPDMLWQLVQYVRECPVEFGGVRLSHIIEDRSAEGTIAEAVFNILAD